MLDLMLTVKKFILKYFSSQAVSASIHFFLFALHASHKKFNWTMHFSPIRLISGGAYV